MFKVIRSFVVLTAAFTGLAICTSALAAPPATRVAYAPLVPISGAWSGSASRSDKLLSDLRPEPWIDALARTLGSDRASVSSADYAKNVLTYVRSNIAVEYRFGLAKGGNGALIDQSGTPFDQAELMVKLLRKKAGVTAVYKVGSATLTGEQFEAWSGTTGGPAACQLLANGGIPATVNGASSCAGSGTLTTVTFAHIWVEANGVTYDPSYKRHDVKVGLGVQSAMGCSSAACGALDAAMVGAEVQSDYVANLKVDGPTGLNAKLNEKAQILQAAIANSNRLGTLEDVVGGKTINQTFASSQDMSQPWLTATTTWNDGIPDAYRTTLRIRYGGVDATVFADEIAGRRVQMMSSSALLVDGKAAPINGCSDCAPGIARLSVNHPYSATGGAYADEEVQFRLNDEEASGGKGSLPLTIVASFGSASFATEKHFAGLQAANPVKTEMSAECGAGALNVTCRADAQPILAARLLAQGAQADKIIARLAFTSIERHHDIGFVYANATNPNAGSYVALSSMLATPYNNYGAARLSDTAWTALASAVGQQIDGSLAQASPFSQFAAANAAGGRFYRIGAGSFAAFAASRVAPNCSGQCETQMRADLAAMGSSDVLIASNSRALLASNGNVTFASLIAENARGGAVGSSDGTSSVFEATRQTEIGLGAGGSIAATGDYSASSVDIVTGQGSFPSSLSFARRYTASGSAIETLDNNEVRLNGNQTAGATSWRYSGLDSAPAARLGGGWTHNLNVTATYSGEGSRAFGAQSGIEASAVIAGLEALRNIVFTNNASEGAVYALIAKWLQDRLIANTVIVDAGGETQSFFRLPDGTFNVANGSPARLTQGGERDPTTKSYGAVTLKYTGKYGDEIDFNWAYAPVYQAMGGVCSAAPVRMGPLMKATQWRFPNGINVNFTYQLQSLQTSVNGSSSPLICANTQGYVLQSVSNNLGRQLNLTTTPVSLPGANAPFAYKITAVTDENSRSISYALSDCEAGKVFTCGTFKVDTPYSEFGTVDGLTTTYSYVAGADSLDPASPMKSKYRLRRWFVASPFASSPQLALQYDAFFRVIRTTDAIGAQTDVYPGGLTGTELRKRGDVVGAPAPTLLPGAPEPTLAQAVVSTTFDQLNNPLVVTDPLNRRTVMAYDPLGRLTKQTAPEENQIQLAYDARSNVISSCHLPKGRKDLTCSTGAGDIQATITYAEAASVVTCANPKTCNRPIAQTNARGYVTNLSWSATTGDLVQVLAPADQAGVRPQTDLGYTSFSGISLLTSKQDKISTTETALMSFGYEPNNHLVPKTVTVEAGAEDQITTFTYDGVGNVTHIDGPRTGYPDIQVFRYDNQRRVRYAIEPTNDGSADGWRRAQVFGYVNVLQTNSGVGIVNNDTGIGYQSKVAEAITYDALGRPIRRTTNSGITQFSYDALGRQTCAVVRMGVTEPPADACALAQAEAASTGADMITRNVYDLASQVRKVEEGVGSSKAQAYLTYDYTANGQVYTQTDAGNNLTRYTYDGFDRLQKREFPVAARGAAQADTSDYESFGYDQNGNVTSFRRRKTNPSVTFGYTYDGLDRVITKTHPTDASKTVTTTYDLLDRPKSALFSSTGQGVNWNYDIAGRKTSETTFGKGFSYGYDTANNRKSITWSSGDSVEYDYDANNRLAAIRDPGSNLPSFGRLLAYTYTPLGQRKFTVFGGTENVSQTKAEYTYEPASERLDTLRYFGFANGQADFTQAFAYDRADNVISETFPSFAEWQPNDTPTSFTYDGKNRDEAIFSVAGGGYDGNGNVINDGKFKYAYDDENRMVNVTTPTGAPVLALEYDPIGRLLKTTNASGAVYRFVYDGDELVAEYDGTGALLRRYVHGSGIDDPTVTYEGAGPNAPKKWLYANRQGSIITEAGWDDPARTTYKYGPYGKPYDWNGSRFRYTGQVMLGEAELYYYKARMYDPSRGRFMQTDPIGYGDGPNMYAYVSGNPTNSRDPSGTLQHGCEETIIYCQSVFPEGTVVYYGARPLTPNYTYNGNSGVEGGFSGRYVSDGLGFNQFGDGSINYNFFALDFGGGGGGGGPVGAVAGAKDSTQTDKRKCGLADYVSQTAKAGVAIAGGVAVLSAVAVAAAPTAAGITVIGTVGTVATYWGIGLTGVGVLAEFSTGGSRAGIDATTSAVGQEMTFRSFEMSLGKVIPGAISAGVSVLDFAKGPNCRY